MSGIIRQLDFVDSEASGHGWLLRGRSDGDDLAEVGESLLELRADHFLAVHKQAEQLAHETVFAIHRPGHHGLVAGGLEGELDRAGAFHRAFPIHTLADEFAGLAFDYGGRPSADLVVSLPT